MSTITATGTTFHDPLEELLSRTAERVDEIVNGIAIESYRLERYEENTTSRLAEAIISTLRNDPITVANLMLEVHIEEFRRAQEKNNGGDLYLSLVRNETLFAPISKGVLVQAKRRTSLLKSGESRRLGNQSKRMYRRSPGSSYIWIYENNGVVCTKAPQSSEPLLMFVADPISVGRLIADGLRCNRGDEDIGRDLSLPLHEGIIDVMRRLSLPLALDFEIKQT
ncbi:hypothetical protein ABID58_006499 [Bradyrhizobium sp. S3.2.6]|uniref:hypothetical protein n=1 Tax=Bradyrhizobium sp. S3.2.6 TaxID=3156428 RepID=UPI0033952A3B